MTVVEAAVTLHCRPGARRGGRPRVLYSALRWQRSRRCAISQGAQATGWHAWTALTHNDHPCSRTAGQPAGGGDWRWQAGQLRLPRLPAGKRASGPAAGNGQGADSVKGRAGEALHRACRPGSPRHPRDADCVAGTWRVRSAAQGLALRSVRAEAEAQVALAWTTAAAHGPLQGGARTWCAVRPGGAGVDHIEASIIDTRTGPGAVTAERTGARALIRSPCPAPSRSANLSAAALVNPLTLKAVQHGGCQPRTSGR